jgi:hypothetical protein
MGMENQVVYGRPRGKRTMMLVLLLMLLAVAIAVSVLFFVKYRHAVASNPNQERENIVNNIKTSIDLPEEDPAMSTVIDKTKLTNPTLQARTENGDKLLIFAKAKRLVIYRPSTNKVVDMLTIQDKQTSLTTDATTNPSAVRR